MKRVLHKSLCAFATDVLRKVGVPEEEGVLVAENLVLADLRGIDTHGLIRLSSYVSQIRQGIIRPGAEFKVMDSFEAGCRADGGHGFGQTVARAAMDIAIEKAQKTGIACVSVANGGHIGAHGNIALRAANAGQFGMVVTCGRPGMAAPGSTSAAIGLTPFAMACPSGHKFPLVLDMALSVAARGHILRAVAEGKPIPPGWAVDSAGDPTTDAEAALQGTLLPVGGYKGYGLAVMLSALAGILSGALDDPAVSTGEGAPEKPFAQGHFIMALDIAKFIPVAEFRRRAGAYIDAIKSTPKSAGANDIYLPGEQSWQRWQDRMQNGFPLSESLSADLRKLGDSLDIKFRPQWAGSENGPARRKGIGTMEANVQ